MISLPFHLPPSVLFPIHFSFVGILVSLFLHSYCFAHSFERLIIFVLLESAFTLTSSLLPFLSFFPSFSFFFRHPLVQSRVYPQTLTQLEYKFWFNVYLHFTFSFVVNLELYFILQVRQVRSFWHFGFHI